MSARREQLFRADTRCRHKGMVELLHRILTDVHQALEIILRFGRRSGAGHASSPCLFLLRNVQIGNRSFESFRGHADRFGQRRMRMDRQTNVRGISAHFDRNRRFAMRSPAEGPTLLGSICP